MPFITVYTNALLKQETKREFFEDLAGLVGDILGFPKKYFVITLNQSVENHFFGESEREGALVSLETISLNDKESELVGTICEFISLRFGLPKDKIKVSLYEISANRTSVAGKVLG